MGAHTLQKSEALTGDLWSLESLNILSCPKDVEEGSLYSQRAKRDLIAKLKVFYLIILLFYGKPLLIQHGCSLWFMAT